MSVDVSILTVDRSTKRIVLLQLASLLLLDAGHCDCVYRLEVLKLKKEAV